MFRPLLFMALLLLFMAGRASYDRAAPALAGGERVEMQTITCHLSMLRPEATEAVLKDLCIVREAPREDRTSAGDGAGGVRR